MATDKAYIDGMEDMANIIKTIFELTTDERERRFGCRLVSEILDKFDFQQIREKMKAKVLKKKYYMKAIREESVIAVSPYFDYKPTTEMIECFFDINKPSFVLLQEIYLYEEN